MVQNLWYGNGDCLLGIDKGMNVGQRLGAHRPRYYGGCSSCFESCT